MLEVLKLVLCDVHFLGAFFQTVITICLGYFFRRRGIVDDSGKKTVTAIVWKIAVPCIAFNAFMQDFNRENFTTSLVEILLAGIIYALLVFLGKLAFIKRVKDERILAALFVAVGQTTLFSLPILQSVYTGRDKEVMLYISSISVVFRIMVYIVGFYIISGERFHIKTFSASAKKIFVTPIMIGMFLGIAVWLLQDFTAQVQTEQGMYSFLRVDKTLPVLYTTVSSFCHLLNPLSMFLIGMSIGEADFSSAVKDKNAWLIAVMRNFFAPVFVLIFCCVLHLTGIVCFNEYSLAALVIGFSAPISVTLSMMCVQFHRHELLASRACFISTLLTIISMPFSFVIIHLALNSSIFK